MREHHRNNAWRLSENGLFIPHSYQETKPDSPTYWDDVGFILNGRRFMVCMQHPRNVYKEAVSDRAMQAAGDPPEEDWPFDGSTKNYRMVGKSGKRKKLFSYTCRGLSDAQREHYAKVREIEGQLTQTGIELSIEPSWTWERWRWAMGVSLVGPMEVRNEKDLAEVAHLARSLVLRQTTLAQRFAGYTYERSDWLRDQAILKAKRDAAVKSETKPD